MPAPAGLFGNSTSNMVELQNLIMLPARRMKSLFSSLLLVVITIRRRYLTFARVANNLSRSGSSGGVRVLVNLQPT